MEYSRADSQVTAATMSINPNAEIFGGSSTEPPTSPAQAPAPPSSPPPPAPPILEDEAVGADGDGSPRFRTHSEEIEGGSAGDGAVTPRLSERRTLSQEIEGGTDGDGSTLHLSVTDPQQIGEGRNAHTYYRIDVRQGQYSDPIASVRRRYSDFQWLFQRLHAEKPGSIIPIIPHHQAVQRAKRLGEELVEERRGHLEKFLRKIQVHPELEGAPSLSAFFSPDAEVFEKAKKANPGNTSTDEQIDGTVPDSAKEKVKHYLVKVGVRAKVARGGELEENRDGARMQEVESYLNTLEDHVKVLSKATLKLVDISKESSTTMHELGQSLFGLHQTHDGSGKSEKSSALPSMKLVSNVLASLSAINRVKHDEDDARVGTPMREIEWSIKAARLALKRRKERQLTYTTYLQQTKNREDALEKVRNKAALSPQPMDEKMQTAQTALDQARASSRAALGDLDMVTQRFFREMGRFKIGVDEELRKLYVAHARIQVEYSGQTDGEWRKLLPGGSAGKPGLVRTSSQGSSAASKAEMMMI